MGGTMYDKDSLADRMNDEETARERERERSPLCGSSQHSGCSGKSG